jgi:hypothetical protein
MVPHVSQLFLHPDVLGNLGVLEKCKYIELFCHFEVWWISDLVVQKRWLGKQAEREKRRVREAFVANVVVWVRRNKEMQAMLAR